MPKDFTIDIDLSKIGKGINTFNMLQKAIDDAIYMGMNDAMDKIEARLRLEMADAGITDSAILGSIQIENYGRNSISIKVYGEEAMFVEYGIGIKGKRDPHPDPQTVGEYSEYDSKRHGDSGWFYKDGKGGVKWTKGQEAKPFMYRTWKYARLIVTKTINNRIRRIKL